MSDCETIIESGQITISDQNPAIMHAHSEKKYEDASSSCANSTHRYTKDGRLVKTITVPAIFNGESGAIYAFDINNLASRWNRKNNYANIVRSDFSNRINSFLPPKSSNYLSFFYASRNFYCLYHLFPNGKHNRWYIEKYPKNSLTTDYMDIDATLTGQVSPILQTYADQITHFYLGSGDLDLHILIDIARARKIPITVIAYDECSTNAQLRPLVDEIRYLYPD